MYFVGRGRLAYFVDELHVHIVYETIGDKDHFGEVEFFFADQRENNVKSATICELLALSREDLFNKIFLEFTDLKLEMIIDAAAVREKLKKLREEVWSKRREQYKRARGLSITLSHLEIGKLVELRPSLKTELVFEDGEDMQNPAYLTVPNSPKPVETSPKSALSVSAPGVSSSPKTSLFPPQSRKDISEFPPQSLINQRELPSAEPASKPVICSQFTLEIPPHPVVHRRTRRSITNPQSGLPTALLDPVKSRISELKTIMNSHTLAAVEEKKVNVTEEMTQSYKRIAAKVTRIEEVVVRLVTATGKTRRASVMLTGQISTLQ